MYCSSHIHALGEEPGYQALHASDWYWSLAHPLDWSKRDEILVYTRVASEQPPYIQQTDWLSHSQTTQKGKIIFKVKICLMFLTGIL